MAAWSLFTELDDLHKSGRCCTSQHVNLWSRLIVVVTPNVFFTLCRSHGAGMVLAWHLNTMLCCFEDFSLRKEPYATLAD